LFQGHVTPLPGLADAFPDRLVQFVLVGAISDHVTFPPSLVSNTEQYNEWEDARQRPPVR
jgi:hypothetical protein